MKNTIRTISKAYIEHGFQIFKILPPLFPVLVKGTMSIVTLLDSVWPSYTYSTSSSFASLCQLHFLQISWIFLSSTSHWQWPPEWPLGHFANSYQPSMILVEYSRPSRNCDVSSLTIWSIFFSMTLLYLRVKFEDYSMAHKTIHDLSLSTFPFSPIAVL